MTGPGPKSQSQEHPLRVAFYGLTASELDLFTVVRRHANASLALVVDPGPMGLARRLAEIAGVPTSSDPWDLVGARPDWIVLGGLARSKGAPLDRAKEQGAQLVEAEDAPDRLAELPEATAVVGGPDTLGPVQPVGEASAGASAEPEAPGQAAPSEVVGLEAHRVVASDAELSVESPLETCTDEFASPADLAATIEAPGTGAPAAGHVCEVAAPAKELQREVPRHRTTLQPLESDAEPASVVNWALDGLMSSVKGRWGVALTRANDDLCFVEKGIDLQKHRPDLWRWLYLTVGEDGAAAEAVSAPPQDSKTLACTVLRGETGVVGAMLLGREEGSEAFSSADRAWLDRAGERVASILCYAASSDLSDSLVREQNAPASVWGAPIPKRVSWMREWVRGQLSARGCWLFIAGAATSELQLIDDNWGTAAPPFLNETVREALQRTEPQVWLEREGDRALILQPLAPWGVKGVLLLEGVPWRGGGGAALARLKRAASIIGKLMNDI